MFGRLFQILTTTSWYTWRASLHLYQRNYNTNYFHAIVFFLIKKGQYKKSLERGSTIFSDKFIFVNSWKFTPGSLRSILNVCYSFVKLCCWYGPPPLWQFLFYNTKPSKCVRKHKILAFCRELPLQNQTCLHSWTAFFIELFHLIFIN